MHFRKNDSQGNYCNSSLQTRSLGSWISAYLSQVYSIFNFPFGPLADYNSYVQGNCTYYETAGIMRRVPGSEKK